MDVFPIDYTVVAHRSLYEYPAAWIIHQAPHLRPIVHQDIESGDKEVFFVGAKHLSLQPNLILRDFLCLERIEAQHKKHAIIANVSSDGYGITILWRAITKSIVRDFKRESAADCHALIGDSGDPLYEESAGDRRGFVREPCCSITLLCEGQRIGNVLPNVGRCDLVGDLEHCVRSGGSPSFSFYV